MLFGVVELNAPETMVLGALVTLVQCYWNQPERPRAAQVVFNVSCDGAGRRDHGARISFAWPMRSWLTRTTSIRPSGWPPRPALCSC